VEVPGSPRCAAAGHQSDEQHAGKMQRKTREFYPRSRDDSFWRARHMTPVPIEPERSGSPVPAETTDLLTGNLESDLLALRRRDALLVAIVDSSDDAIISKNLDGQITSWNKSAERVFGYTATEAIGKTVAELLIPDDRQDEEPDILSRLRRGERVDHFETVRRRRDNSVVDVSLTISPVRDPGGKIIGASKIARDISGRKATERLLRQSEERFRQIAELGPQFVWLSGPQGELEFVNQRWTDFSGLDLEGTKDPGQLALRLHHEDKVVEHWAESVRTGIAFEAEARLRGKDGEFRWFVIRSVPVRDENGRILRWFGTSTDIHQNKMLQFELQSANQDLEQFAYSATHDLQEPLRTIRIYSQLLQARHRSELTGKAGDFLDYITKAATRMEMLVRDLFMYSQVPRQEIPSEGIDAQEALAATLADLGGAISQSGAVVTSDSLPAVRVNSTHLKQLFQNLIGNAIKYRNSDRAPAVHISAHMDHDMCVFTVRDNGIGIDNEYKEQIFGLFTRLHSGDQYSGTGIGLAICQRIVDRYHGRIWVDSEPGCGSSFRFAIPA
jgi:PAS domain S-box-containing protein